MELCSGHSFSKSSVFSYFRPVFKSSEYRTYVFSVYFFVFVYPGHGILFFGLYFGFYQNQFFCEKGVTRAINTIIAQIRRSRKKSALYKT